MATVYRPTVTKPMPPGAEMCVRKGEPRLPASENHLTYL